MREADNIDKQRSFREGRLQQPFQRHPSQQHHARSHGQLHESSLRLRAPPDLAAFYFEAWTPELDEVLPARTYNLAAPRSGSWPETVQHTPPPTVVQRELPLLWHSHIGPDLHGMSPEIVGNRIVGSRAVEGYDD